MIPHENHNWSTSDEFHFNMVSKSFCVVWYMSRDRFRKLKSCLQFADNNNLEPIKVAKVLPLYNIRVRNKRLQQFGVFSKPLAIDESMVPYFGRHRSKMFIRGKPVRFGYKIWCMCRPDGYPYRLEIYCGNKSVASDSAGLKCVICR